MDELAVNKAFQIGFDRTNDLLELMDEGDDGEAELVGMFICIVLELGERWNMSPRKAIRHVSRVL